MILNRKTGEQASWITGYDAIRSEQKQILHSWYEEERHHPSHGESIGKITRILPYIEGYTSI
jgi:hypothetical protein